MGHMVISLLVGTGQIKMTRSKMEGSWTCQIGDVIDTGTILGLVMIGIMIIIFIILTGGVTRNIFWMSLRKKIHLHFMER